MKGQSSSATPVSLGLPAADRRHGATLTPSDLADTYVLTGPEALTFDEAAATIGKAAGRPVSHQRITPDELTAILNQAGLPADYAASIVLSQVAIAEGHGAVVAGTVRDVGAKQPVRFVEYAAAAACSPASVRTLCGGWCVWWACLKQHVDTNPDRATGLLRPRTIGDPPPGPRQNACPEHRGERHLSGVPTAKVAAMTDKFAHPQHASAALDPLARVIGSDLPYWRTRHINITRWGKTDASGKMMIHLKSYSPAAAAELCLTTATTASR